MNFDKDAEERGWLYGECVLSKYTSTLMNNLVFGRGMLRLYKEPTASGELLRSRLTRPAFDALRADPRFAAIEARLREYAAQNKGMPQEA